MKKLKFIKVVKERANKGIYADLPKVNKKFIGKKKFDKPNHTRAGPGMAGLDSLSGNYFLDL